MQVSLGAQLGTPSRTLMPLLTLLLPGPALLCQWPAPDPEPPRDGLGAREGPGAELTVLRAIRANLMAAGERTVST